MISSTKDSSFHQVQIEDNITSAHNYGGILDYQKKNIEKGSINECIINLCIISVGVGLLALPQKEQ